MIKTAFPVATLAIAAALVWLPACSSGGDSDGHGGGGGAGAGGMTGVAGTTGAAGASGPAGSNGAAGRAGSGGSPGLGGTGGNYVAGVSRSKTVSSLTDAEKAALCDWYVPQLGGYGAPRTCSMALIDAPADQASCISGFPSCNATVGNLADCLGKVGAAQATCTGVTATATSACLTSASCLN
jgi:hypothetical protein